MTVVKLTNKLPNSMEEISSWEIKITRLGKKFSAFYGTLRFITMFSRVRAGLYLSNMNPVRNLTPYFPKIHSNIILPSTPMSYELSLLFRFSNQNSLCIFNLSHPCHMAHPSRPPWFDDRNNFWWSVQVMKLLIIKSSPASRHFLPLRSKYSPQRPVLEHPQSMFFP